MTPNRKNSPANIEEDAGVIVLIYEMLFFRYILYIIDTYDILDILEGMTSSCARAGSGWK